MTITTFKPGDRVRTKGSRLYPDGTEFTVERVVEKGSTGTFGPGYTAYVTGDPKNLGVWTSLLELVESETPDPSEYRDPRYEGALRQVNDLQAVLRKRNETIDTQRARLTEYAEQLEAVFDSGAFPFKPLRDLQRRIGEGNAERGFHEQGRDLRQLADNADDHHLHAETATQMLRDYATARLALITTEVAEAIEELRNGSVIDETYYVAVGALEVDGAMQDVEVPAAALKDPEDEDHDHFVALLGEGPRKPEGVPSELADIVIRTFDFADEFGIDLAAMIDEKISYNQTRGQKHGKQF